MITRSRTMRNGGIINIIKQVQQSYFIQNKTLLTNQLTNAVDLPWLGVVFNQNTLTQIISCSNTLPQISFTCDTLKDEYSSHLLPLEEDDEDEEEN